MELLLVRASDLEALKNTLSMITSVNSSPFKNRDTKKLTTSFTSEHVMKSTIIF